LVRSEGRDTILLTGLVDWNDWNDLNGEDVIFLLTGFGLCVRVLKEEEEEDPFVCLCGRLCGREAERGGGDAINVEALLVRPRVKAGRGPRAATGKRAALDVFV
jgi:hypothetical protein